MTEEPKQKSPMSNGMKRKLSVGSMDEEYLPTVEEHIGGSVDDESSIQNDEDSKNSDEVDTLKKESELPIEELMVMYGFPNKQLDYLKFKEESQESGSDVESTTELDERMQIFDRDDWKKDISIGPEFQAQIPHMVDEEARCEEDDSTLLWSPDRLDPKEIHRYLNKVYSEEELPVVDSNRDDEEALFHLHTHKYDVESALQGTSDVSTVNKPMKPWEEEECQGFENGLKMYGKQFRLIQKNLVPNRSVDEVIQFYYLWKKTERYDIFIQYSRIGTKRYIFNPGQPLDIDRSAYICSQDSDKVCSNSQDSDKVCSNSQESDKVCSNSQESDKVCSNSQDSDKVCSNSQEHSLLRDNSSQEHSPADNNSQESDQPTPT